jgi:Spy/CpxP family protein refolding chaperone
MRRDESMGILGRLDLSEQQKEQVRTFQHEHRLEVIDLRAEITKLRLQKEKALRDYDFRNARSLNDRLHNKMGELASKDIELREKIHQVLTTEQREELREAPRSRMMRRDIDDSE